LNQLLDLTKATAYAQFWAKWDIEDHDYVVFQATQMEKIENLCGNQSKPVPFSNWPKNRCMMASKFVGYLKPLI
jgi:hypothetical protein